MTNRPDDRRPGGSGRRLVALLGLTLLFGALLAPLPLRIRAGNQAQRVLAALDAVRPPLLALERTTTRLVQAPEAPPGRFAARLRACDAAVARFTAAARLDRPTREAAGAFRDAYRKWRANLVRLREHLHTERRHDHAGRHLTALSAEFVRLLVTLAAAEQPLHRTMAAGRRAMNLAGTLAILYLLLAFLVVFRHQQRTAEAIRATGRRLEALLDQAPEATLLLDASGTVLEWNPAAERIFGWRRDEALGRPLHELIVPPRWQARYRACLQRLPALGGEAPARTLRSDRYSARHRDGRLLPVEFTLVPLQHEETLYAAFLRDLTELHRAQEELRLAAITFQTHAGIVITDARGTILRVNPAYEAMTGYRAEELVGKNPRILQSGRQPPEFYARMWRDLLDKGQWQGELWNRRKDGRLYCQVLTITAVRDDEGRTTHYIGTSQDITALRRAEAEARYRAYHDELTGLPNRRWLLERLEQERATARRLGARAALLCLDLDRFTQVNDTAGHAAGDRILQETAARLRTALPAEGFLARIASDEFAVLLPPGEGDAARTGLRAQELAEALQERLARPYHVGGREYVLGASIGITLFPDRERRAETVMEQADHALRRAKEEPGGIRFYRPEMQAHVRNRLRLEEALRHSLEREEGLELHYQPLVDGTGRIRGAEALLRWRQGAQGLVPPLHFIPVAEASGLIHALGSWVLRTACRQLRTWLDQGLDASCARIALNVSPRQFAREGFVKEIQDILRATGVAPRLLEIEITEGVIMADVEAAIDRLATLQVQGIHIAIDDFGTGYSSMSYLKQLPADHLKIDRGFVRDLHVDPGDARIVETIISMAHNLGLGVVAEGVENEAHFRFLTERGCDFMQGFHFSPPVPAEQFLQLARLGRLPAAAEARRREG